MNCYITTYIPEFSCGWVPQITSGWWFSEAKLLIALCLSRKHLPVVYDVLLVSKLIRSYSELMRSLHNFMRSL